MLAPGTCPLATLLSWPFARPATAPPTSGTNFGFEVVPSIAKGIPLLPLRAAATFDRPPTTPPCRSANILKASAPSGLTVPAPVITPIAGMLRLMSSGQRNSADTKPAFHNRVPRFLGAAPTSTRVRLRWDLLFVPGLANCRLEHRLPCCRRSRERRVTAKITSRLATKLPSSGQVVGALFPER